MWVAGKLAITVYENKFDIKYCNIIALFICLGFVFLFSFLRLFNLLLKLSNVNLILIPSVCTGG